MQRKQKTQASEPPPPVQWLSLNLSRRRPASNSTFLLERSLLPLSSVRLARLVRNPKDPCQDFIDPPVPPSASDIIMEHHKDISETQRSAKTSSLRARFASRVSVSAEFREASVAVIKAKDARSYQLPNSSNWFRKAKENAEVCRWMEEGGGGEVYFVEGFRTVIETHLREAKTFGSCSAQDGEIGEALAQAGNERDLVGGVEETQADSHERSLYAAEETIYAIQYRRVERGWLSKNAKSATLDPNSRWEIMWGHMR